MNDKSERSRAGWRASWRVGLVCLVSVVAPAAHAACTGQDIAGIVSRTNAANAAIRAGNLKQYVQAMRDSNAQVPAECRPVLDRLQPMATRCMAEEKRLAMDAFAIMMRAAPVGDVRRMLAAYDALERAVTPRCWIGINLRNEPDVVSNCSPAELEGLAALAGSMEEARRYAAAVRQSIPGYGVADFLAAFRFDTQGEALFREGAKRVGMT